MKKSIVITIFLLVLLAAGVTFLNVTNAASIQGLEDQEQSISYPQNNMMRYDNQIYLDDVYERLYMHVSVTDREYLDTLFATELKNSNLSSKTIEEAVIAIEEIKETILDDIVFEDLSYSYGMMGGRMMGGSRGSYSGCGYSSNIYSYEWYYLHSYGSDRSDIDLKFAELMIGINMTDLTIEEIIQEISDLKVVMIEYILSLNSLDE